MIENIDLDPNNTIGLTTYVKDLKWHNGKLWILDEVGGLFKYENGIFTNESPGINRGTSIEFDAYDTLWIGTKYTNSTVAVYGFKNGNYMFYNNSNSGFYTNKGYQAFKDSYDRTWISHWNVNSQTGSGYSMKDENGIWDSLFYDKQGLTSPQVRKFAQDDFGNIWCATINGLGLYNEVTQQWSVYDKSNTNLPSEFVSDIQFDPAGRIWIYLRDTALAYSYNATDWTILDINNSPNDIYLEQGFAFYFVIDSFNNVWASGYQSLHIYNPDGFNNSWLSNQENSMLNQILIYPNPATNQITITGVNANLTYQIFNNLGQKQNIKQSKNGIINIEHLSCGVYFIQITNGNNVTVKKFIKQ